MMIVDLLLLQLTNDYQTIILQMKVWTVAHRQLYAKNEEIFLLIQWKYWNDGSMNIDTTHIQATRRNWCCHKKPI